MRVSQSSVEPFNQLRQPVRDLAHDRTLHDSGLFICGRPIELPIDRQPTLQRAWLLIQQGYSSDEVCSLLTDSLVDGPLKTDPETPPPSLRTFDAVRPV